MSTLPAAVLPFTTPGQRTRPLREIPLDEQPRTRLLAHGAGALADSEIIALLLGSGSPQASALDLARQLLASVGSLNGLIGARPEAIQRPGLGAAKAATLLAAVELGRRLARNQVPDREPLLHPGAIARYLLLAYGVPDQEVMGALYLDVRHRLLAVREAYRGTLSRAAVEPRALLKEGLLQGAAALVLFHTHPSGDPSPSAEDLTFTRRLAEAGELVGVRLLDHLVLGSTGAWVSLRERGGWS